MSEFFSSWSASVSFALADRDADARADRDLVPVDVVVSLQAVDDALGEHRSLVERHHGILQHHELVAAEAGDHVAFAHDRAQPLGDRDEQEVAARMAERVVDLLELVEIDEVHGAHLLRRAGGKRVVHAAAQDGAVGQSGERVEARKVVDLGLRDLALGDVLADQHHAAVLHRLDGELERASVVQVDDEGVAFGAGEANVEIVHQAFGLIGRDQPAVGADGHELLRREALQLEVRRQAEVLVEPLVGDDDAPLGVEHAQGVRHVVERGVEALGKQRHVPRRDHRIEQREAQPLGDEFDREEERSEQARRRSSGRYRRAAAGRR